MGFFDKVKNSVSHSATDVSQKVSYASRIMKINNQMTRNDEEIDRITYEIGVQHVEKHLKDMNSEHEDLLSKIRQLRAQNQDSIEEIESLKKQQEEERQRALEERQAQRELERKQEEERKRMQQELLRQQEQARQQDQFYHPEVLSTENPVQSPIVNVTCAPVVICGNCGGQNEADAKFCVHCGTTLRVASITPEVVYETPTAIYETSQEMELGKEVTMEVNHDMEEQTEI